MTDTGTCAPIRTRSLEDLLSAEREFRESIEADRRALADVLYDLAMRLDGERLEAMRLTDPTIPKYWTAEDWRRFFDVVQTPQSSPLPAIPWGLKGSGKKQGTKKTAEQNAVLSSAQPAETKQVERVERDTPQPTLSSPSTATHRVATNLLAEYSEPPKPDDLRMAGVLKGKRWRRGTMAMYLIARQGINTMMEIDLSIVTVEPELKTLRTNSVRAPLKELVEGGYLIEETLDVRRGDFVTNLKTFRLSEKGKAFSFRMGWDAVESDWERLITRHEGLRFPAHTAAVLLFAVHARRRGYRVTVVPDTDGPYAPDIRMATDEETLDVEVELGTKERPQKWKNMAAAQGFVALCAATEAGRKRLVADCRAAGISGVATDLHSLRAISLEDITPATPIWMEEFKP
ncbi:hypothetical protein D6833_09615 [Candidatus Parcubacteria bacterium]|nr:MAG: hypothetical protein D6833_09615 [Candidatus Parcubacteria bacterium]